jgi:hypothetical protein
MPEVLKTIGLTANATPLKERLANGQQYEAGIVPPGEFTIIWFFMATKGML